MAHIIKANGEVKLTQPTEPPYFSLKELNAIVGGYIEVIPLGYAHWMILNEEGKLKGLPYNDIATHLSGLWPNDHIVGDVLICKHSELER